MKYQRYIRGRRNEKMEVKTFDIVLVDFGEVIFAGEQGGIRPAVIIQNNTGNTYSGTTIVMPFTTKIKHVHQSTHSFFYKDLEKGLSKDSILLGECVRQISKERILKKLGSIIKLQEKKKVKTVYDANFGDWEI
jgi:mRNA interferase MazF